MRNKIFSKVIFFILVWVIFFSAYAEEIKINTKAPNFNLVDLEGNNVSLSNYSGKVVALFFWASWCPHCQKETLKLIKLKQEFGERLEVLAINYRESASRIKDFALKYKINYKIPLDEKRDLFKLYNIVGVPVVIILDRKGLVQFKGAELPKNYREIFEELLIGEAADSSLKEKGYFIEERLLLKDIPKDTKDLFIWIPHPVADRCQTIEDFKLTGPFDYRIIKDKEYANTIVYLKPKKQALNKNPVEIGLSFKLKRKEYSMSDAELSPPQNLKRFLKADKRVPVKGEIKELAEKIVVGKDTEFKKVRAIYDYLIEELTYSKDDPKICGIGDSLLTLKHKKGICTDYHSLFISLVRSLGIPAKFEIGFRMPNDVQKGKLNGYHCWAKFYLKDKGWIPVDISEADKHPQMRDYFFGHIDENRVHLTSGRDINLLYAQDKEALPLNFFIYPYVELNGLQFNDMDIEISYKALKGGD